MDRETPKGTAEIDLTENRKLMSVPQTALTRDQQIERIQALIMELASGNLSQRAEVSEEFDELDAITIGINMLAEELQATTVSKEYLGRIYRGVVDILLVLNPDFTIQAVNAAVLKQLQYDEDELIGKPLSILFYRNESKSIDKIQRELHKQGYSFNTERVLRTKKGKPIPVSISAAQLHDGDHEIDGILCIAKDISIQKKKEEELRKKNEELNSFIYRVSHDIKGPLSSILGLIYLAKSDIDNLESVTEYIDLIEQSANRLDRIIAELLQLSSISQHDIKHSATNLEQMVEEILQSLAYTPEYQDVRFIVDFKAAPIINAKKVLMKTTLQNLIHNAIIYKNPENPNHKVTIRIDDLGSSYSISVADTGIGMTKNTQENVFKMFFRGDRSSKGTGLGLYIVKSSVEAMDGTIEIKSKPEQGSTFKVTFPKKAIRKKSEKE
ncbi:MAG: PAS domain-containing protein [Sphingobacteriales bacterium]|nr:MAG: PAS domain-containing protein [Sphingobacteriales bacterium]